MGADVSRARCAHWTSAGMKYVSCSEHVVKMLDLAKSDESYTQFAVLFLVTYVFLLRLPSEALPIVVGEIGQTEAKAVLQCVGDKLVLKLERRKNKPQGSTLTRGCWCSKEPRACPTHVLGPSEQVSCGIGMFCMRFVRSCPEAQKRREHVQRCYAPASGVPAENNAPIGRRRRCT